MKYQIAIPADHCDEEYREYLVETGAPYRQDPAQYAMIVKDMVLWTYDRRDATSFDIAEISPVLSLLPACSLEHIRFVAETTRFAWDPE
jgi:hypothetical protein